MMLKPVSLGVLEGLSRAGAARGPGGTRPWGLEEPGCFALVRVRKGFVPS